MESVVGMDYKTVQHYWDVMLSLCQSDAWEIWKKCDILNFVYTHVKGYYYINHIRYSQQEHINNAPWGDSCEDF